MRHKYLLVVGILSLACLQVANAALVGRAGGAAYYDDVLDVTWVADANLAASTTFGVAALNGAFGVMNPDTADDWISAMNGAGYLGVSDWRLPVMLDIGDPGCNGIGFEVLSGSDCRFNVLTTDGGTVYSEMASLFYDTLGNPGFFLPDGTQNPACVGSISPAGICLVNSGPFENVGSVYWAGLPPVNGFYWFFNFGSGEQNLSNPGSVRAWAVRDGDIAVVPLPATAPLLLSGLVAIYFRRKRAA